jgi:hypothetical protein
MSNSRQWAPMTTRPDATIAHSMANNGKKASNLRRPIITGLYCTTTIQPTLQYIYYSCHSSCSLDKSAFYHCTHIFIVTSLYSMCNEIKWYKSWKNAPLIQAGLGVGGWVFSSLPKPEYIRYGSDVQPVLLTEQSTNKVSCRTAWRQRAAKVTKARPVLFPHHKSSSVPATPL